VQVGGKRGVRVSAWERCCPQFGGRRGSRCEGTGGGGNLVHTKGGGDTEFLRKKKGRFLHEILREKFLAVKKGKEKCLALGGQEGREGAVMRTQREEELITYLSFTLEKTGEREIHSTQGIWRKKKKRERRVSLCLSLREENEKCGAEIRDQSFNSMGVEKRRPIQGEGGYGGTGGEGHRYEGKKRVKRESVMDAL